MIEPAAQQVPHRIATERECSQENDVYPHDERAKSHAELTAVGEELAAAVGRPPESKDGVLE